MSTNMETGRHPYKMFENEDFDGIPSHAPPPYYVVNGQTSATVVVNQPQTVSVTVQSPSPSFMWLSIISCCFCWPMAVCAIMLSYESTSASGRGDYVTARSKGQRAMSIAIAAILIGCVTIAVVVVVDSYYGN